MDINSICQMTKRPFSLNALHACRVDHPLNKLTDKPYWNAVIVCSQDKNINLATLQWLVDKAKENNEI